MFNKSTIQKELKVDVAVSDRMANNIDLWGRLYSNLPPWVSDTVKTLGLPAAIAGEFARLVTLEVETEVENNDYLNEQYQEVIKQIRRYCEYGCATGGLVFKPYPSGENIEVDLVQADKFFPTSYNSRGEITGAVFVEVKVIGDKKYTRLEYHNLNGTDYYISNTAYESKNTNIPGMEDNIGKQVPLASVEEWADLEEETTIKNIERPLFSYFKIPLANRIDTTSPLGVSVFSDAIDLIKEADKQYSRILWEYEGSELAVNASIDCFKLDINGKPILPEGKERLYNSLDYGVGEFNKALEVFSPEIRDSSLFNGLNQLLRRIEFQCGLAYGTLSDVNESDKTATEIKASKQRSYSTVKDIQNSLEEALEHLVYIMSVWAKLYNLNTNMNYDITFNWDDSLVLDKDTELESMRQDVASGIIRAELYIMKKYGVSEEEARKMMPDTQDTINSGPFGEVE